MIYVLVEGADSFAVDDQCAQGFIIVGCWNGFTPDPEAFGTGIDCRTYSESTVSLVEYDPIHEETLARSVLTSHCDDPNLALDLFQERFGLIRDHIFF